VKPAQVAAVRKGGGLFAPLFVQVLALVLVTLAAAAAINLGIVFLLPPPGSETYWDADVAQALKQPGQAHRDSNGRMLIARPITTPTVINGEKAGQSEGALAGMAKKLAPSSTSEPAPINRPWPGPREAVFIADFAQRLGLPIEKVRVFIRSRRGDPIGAMPRVPGVPDNATNQQQQAEAVARQQQIAALSRQGPRPELFILAPFTIEIQRPNGQWLRLSMEESGVLFAWQRQILLWFAISGLALAPIAYLFARRLSAPFAGFAAAAERLGRDPHAPPLKVEGPTEISVAAVAFNEMQDRLRRYVDDRTAMVGAVAHDLRTPLTRLRFRVEGAPDPLRARMTADIEQMDAMISATLAFVRDATHEAQRTKLELSSLVQSIADEMAETGADVSAEDHGSVVIEGDPIALRRLVTNLLDNAVKFGGQARARVYKADEAAIIEVDDDGPGVPEIERERVFEPFHRGEPSRSRETGGAGLGLAVVRSVARAHGGDAALENRREGGLRARATLPL
jgi:signal transduction histidine kinase